MRKVKLGAHEYEIYDGAIAELPARRFHLYNRLLLIDAGIGSDLSDLDAHIDRTIRFIKQNPELAVAEMDNMRQNVYFMQSGISPKHMAFCALIYKIDGKEVTDLTDSGLKELQEITGSIPMNEVTAHLEAVKKKIDEELALYFPKLFEDASIKEYYDKLRQKILLMLDDVINETNSEDKIEEIDNWLITFAKPNKFSGSNSVEVQYDKQYESMCLMLSKNFNVNSKDYSLLEYYNAFENLKEMSKPKKGSK